MANLYLIERTDDNWNYDVYDSAVVVAMSEYDAALIHPGSDKDYEFFWSVDDKLWFTKLGPTTGYFGSKSWLPPSQVSVTLIGTAAPHLKPGTVVCASFNAG